MEMLITPFGIIKILIDGKEKMATIGEGFIEVTKEKVVAIVDSAEWPEEIDIDRAVSSKNKAENQLGNENLDKEMEHILKMTIERANNRIKLVNGK